MSEELRNLGLSNQMSQNLSFDEFLVVVNGRDLEGSFTVPKPDVAERTTEEIEQGTGLKSRNMGGESDVETCQYWVRAQPGRFITQTRLIVDGVCQLLLQNRAKCFEITFHNTKDNLSWGDQILLAVRYECAT